MRMELNLAAIQDLFENYDLTNFVPKSTGAFLLAEKQLQYAIRSIYILGRKKSLFLLCKSLSQKISWRLWKSYIIYCLGFFYPPYLTK